MKHSLTTLAFIASTAVALLCAGCASTSTSETPAGFPLQYSQDFADARSLADVTFSDPNAWQWSDASLALVAPSDYHPPFRSPLSIALIDDLLFGDFVLEAELMQTGPSKPENGHRDLCLFFGFEGPERFYYTHLAPAPDEHAHNVFVVDAAARRALAPVAEAGVDWSDGWHRVRLERIDGVVRAYFDDLDAPLFEVHGATSKGRVGFGSFDDAGRVRSVRIWAPSVERAVGAAFETE